MLVNDLTEEKRVDCEEEGIELRTLVNAMDDRWGVGFTDVHGDEMVIVGEVEGETNECWTRDAKWWGEGGQWIMNRRRRGGGHWPPWRGLFLCCGLHGIQTEMLKKVGRNGDVDEAVIWQVIPGFLTVMGDWRCVWSPRCRDQVWVFSGVVWWWRVGVERGWNQWVNHAGCK